MAGLSVSLEDGYGGACPVTHAINFSSKVKPWQCCYEHINGSGLGSSCVFFKFYIWVLFSSPPESPGPIICHIAVVNFLPAGAPSASVSVGVF